MFAREAAAYARLSHPAIVKLFDFFSDAGQLVMVLEYVDGLPLHKLRALLKPRGWPSTTAPRCSWPGASSARSSAAHSAQGPAERRVLAGHPPRREPVERAHPVGRAGEDCRLRDRQGRRRRQRQDAGRASSRALTATWRPSRSAARRSRCAPTCTPGACFCGSCSPGERRSCAGARRTSTCCARWRSRRSRRSPRFARTCRGSCSTPWRAASSRIPSSDHPGRGAGERAARVVQPGRRAAEARRRPGGGAAPVGDRGQRRATAPPRRSPCRTPRPTRPSPTPSSCCAPRRPRLPENGAGLASVTSVGAPRRSRRAASHRRAGVHSCAWPASRGGPGDDDARDAARPTRRRASAASARDPTRPPPTLRTRRRPPRRQDDAGRPRPPAAPPTAPPAPATAALRRLRRRPRPSRPPRSRLRARRAAAAHLPAGAPVPRRAAFAPAVVRAPARTAVPRGLDTLAGGTATTRSRSPASAAARASPSWPRFSPSPRVRASRSCCGRGRARGPMRPRPSSNRPPGKSRRPPPAAPRHRPCLRRVRLRSPAPPPLRGPTPRPRRRRAGR